MKVIYTGKPSKLELLNNKIYEARLLHKGPCEGWYGIVDETDEEYAYPPDNIVVVEYDENTDERK